MEHKESVFHTYGYTTYAVVWLGLLSLTIITVALAEIDLGSLNNIAAIFIATLKSLLVLIFFMNLKNESGLLKIMIAGILGILVLLGILTYFDIAFR